MKSNSFIYIIAVVLIAHLINWIVLISAILSHCWRKFMNWRCVRRRQQQKQNKNSASTTRRIMYEFRPFELTRCEYKSYAKATSIGRGINCKISIYLKYFFYYKQIIYQSFRRYPKTKKWSSSRRK